ncbi:MAG TPA: hypothetical protein VJH33_03100 [Candidatus Paceibacterota bacterium]
MEYSRVLPRGAMSVTASCALALLLGVFGWQLAVWKGPSKTATHGAQKIIYAPVYEEKDTDSNGIPDWKELFPESKETNNAQLASIESSQEEKSPDDTLLEEAGSIIATQLLGQYVALKQAGTYTPSAGERIGKSVAGSMRYVPTFEKYTRESLQVSEDISWEKTLAYRGELREALEPLLQNTAAEFDTFARYIATGDDTYLKSFVPVAERYREAANAAGSVFVPEDAVDTHVRMINSLLQFASVLDGMTKWGNDPFASAVLLQTYNTAEREVFYAFDALAAYYVQKTRTI